MARIFELADKIVQLLVKEQATHLEVQHALACVGQHTAFHKNMAEFEDEQTAQIHREGGRNSRSLTEAVVAQLESDHDLRHRLLRVLDADSESLRSEVSRVVRAGLEEERGAFRESVQADLSPGPPSPPGPPP